MPPFFLIDEMRGNSPVSGASMVAQTVRNLPAMQETQVQSLRWEDPLEKGMASFIPTSVFSPIEPHGQRSLAGSSP